MSEIDYQQFGAIPKSSTVHALISTIHSWLMNTDGNGATTRVVLFDFRKAFDLIDHNILLNKLALFNIPLDLAIWIVDFLEHRKACKVRKKMSLGVKRPSGRCAARDQIRSVVQLFLIMINDLHVLGVNLWKYVDDVTMSESFEKHQPSNTKMMSMIS